jgi:hypothetical protein
MTMFDDPNIPITSIDQAHAVVGGFVLRCSLMNYRAGQMIAHWFCTDEREKQLSYVVHNMDFRLKRDIVIERLSRHHPAANELRSAMDEAERIMQRRDLAAQGLLSGPPQGPFFLKSFSAGRFLRGDGESDILDVAEIPQWSMRATAISEELVRLTDRLNRNG